MVGFFVVLLDEMGWGVQYATCTRNSKPKKGNAAMNDFMHFMHGFLKGAKETPVAFFTPAIAAWRLLVETSDSLTTQNDKSHKSQ